MTGTLISSDVDFDRPGKQAGVMRVPNSEHRSAYGWIPVPVVVVANGEGPTVLLMAGNHGDEYEGQIALTKLAGELEPENVQGRVIILTMTNYPAAEAGLRTSPIDGGNLDRAFPSDPRGGPTDMIAHYIEYVLMPLSDYMVALHSGGSSLFYPATMLRGMGHNEDEAVKLRALQDAFDLPYAWIFTGGGDVDIDILQLIERGIRRILHSLEVLLGYQPDKVRGTRELHAKGSVFSREIGLYEPFKGIADEVAEGEVIGQILHPDTPWKAPGPVTSPYGGIVLAKRTMGQVRRGDAVCQIAVDAG